MKTNFLLLIFIAISGCAKDSDSSNDTSRVPDGARFELHVSNGMSFNQDSKRAKVHSATKEIVSFKATDWYFRIHGLGFPDSGAAETDRLGKNNTMLSMKVEINGKKVRVGCDPADTPKGLFNRTSLTDDTISGEFYVEFVSCDDYMTGKPVNYPDKPFYVKGNFSNFPLKK